MPSQVKSFLGFAALLAMAAATAVPKTSHLRRQEDDRGRSIDGINCGTFATASSFDTNVNVSNLEDDGAETAVFVAAGSCGRVGCVSVLLGRLRQVLIFHPTNLVRHFRRLRVQ
jgi:hypothetical protein